jgi:hypothetical protein
MLMRQRDTPLNHDQSLGHVFPLQEISNRLVTTGVGRPSCRRTTEALQALFDRVWRVERWRWRRGLGGTALAP